VRLFATLILSVASYHLIEVPIRRRRFLASGRAIGVATLVIALVGISAAGAASRKTSNGPTFAALHGIPADAALGAYGSPDQIDAIPKVRLGTKGVLIVGDSMAGALGNGLTHTPWGQKLQRTAGITVANFGQAACALGIGDMVLQGQVSAPSHYCDPAAVGDQWPQMWSKVVTAFQPSVSILETRLDLVDRIRNGSIKRIGQPAYDKWLVNQLNLAVSILSSHRGKVLLCTSPLYSTGEQPDGSPWPEDAAWRVRRFNQLVRQVASDHPDNVGILEIGSLMSPRGHYANVIQGIPVRFTDGIHWTNGGDWLIFTKNMNLITGWADRSGASNHSSR